MSTVGSRWEHGSFLPAQEVAGPAAGPAALAGAQLFANGRAALGSIVEAGIAERRWRRLLVPGYFCQEALVGLVDHPIELVAYEHLPGRSAVIPSVAAGDVVLANNLLGLGAALDPPVGCDVIEDHTHDPFGPAATGSRASYCIASLRKTVAVPDGAAAWSPRGLPVPAPVPDPRIEPLAEAVFGAMVAKRRYLEGDAVDKASYRADHARALHDIEHLGPARASQRTMALLQELDHQAERRTRMRNHDLLGRALERLGIDFLRRAADAAPVGLTVVTRPDRRDAVVTALTERDVYPAILWSLEQPVVGPTQAELVLSRSVLTLHIDSRYDELHLRTLAGRLGEVLR